jgi:hypothetical protein
MGQRHTDSGPTWLFVVWALLVVASFVGVKSNQGSTAPQHRARSLGSLSLGASHAVGTTTYRNARQSN